MKKAALSGTLGNIFGSGIGEGWPDLTPTSLLCIIIIIHLKEKLYH